MCVARDRSLNELCEEKEALKQQPSCLPPVLYLLPGGKSKTPLTHLAAILLEHTMTYSEAPLAACVYVCDRSAHQPQPTSGALLPLPMHKHPCELVVSCEHRNPHCDTVLVSPMCPTGPSATVLA